MKISRFRETPVFNIFYFSAACYPVPTHGRVVKLGMHVSHPMSHYQDEEERYISSLKFHKMFKGDLRAKYACTDAGRRCEDRELA